MTERHLKHPYELRSLPFLPPEKIKTLNEESLYKFYFSTILRAEDIFFPGRNARIHKLIFLVGGPENDVSVAKDEKGQSIYANQPNYPKLPEIPEATAAISEYFVSMHDNKPDSNLIEVNLIKAMSEIADVFHNLVELTRLDSDYEKIYKNDCIKHLAMSLGSPNSQFSVNDGLLLAYIKYRERLIDAQVKNNQNENMLIKRAMTPGNSRESLIQIPTDKGLACAYRAMNEFGHDVLKPRLLFIKRRAEWNGHV